MAATVLPLVSAGMLALWGIAHLFPTRRIVKGFGAISPDNRLIITMEWIVEGIALLFVAAITALAALLGDGSDLARAILTASVALLIVMAGVSLFTGARVAFFAFRLCPAVFVISALLIAAGVALGSG